MRYYKTKLKGISVSKSGLVKNTISQKVLKTGKRGYFIFDGKNINLAKLMIETFYGIKCKTGRVVFKDGNKENFSYNNLEYNSKFNRVEKPNEIDLLNILKV